MSEISTDDIPDCDMITYGFPCQDISVAGKQEGIIHGQTRSGLLYEALRIIEAKKPKYAIAENVKNLVGKRHRDDFDSLLDELSEMGYNSYWQVLNAKEYGIPQNRERVFVVSIRKDIDDGKFEFPEPFDNRLRLKDMLEDRVESTYYINNEKTDRLLDQLKKKNISNSIRVGGRGSTDRHQWDLVSVPMKVGNVNPSERGMNGNVYNSNNVSPTLTTNKGEGIKVICAQRGRYNADGKTEQQLEVQKEEVSNTLTSVQKDNLVLESDEAGIAPTIEQRHSELPCIYDDRDKGFGIKTQDVCPTQRANRSGIKCIQTDYRIRKLTPLECWRLMGFKDEDYWKARKALEAEYYNGRDRSNSQMYKMAGNSICVPVLHYIFKNLFNT